MHSHIMPFLWLMFLLPFQQLHQPPSQKLTFPYPLKRKLLSWTDIRLCKCIDGMTRPFCISDQSSAGFYQVRPWINL
jgi:hypothetical protein